MRITRIASLHFNVFYSLITLIQTNKNRNLKKTLMTSLPASVSPVCKRIHVEVILTTVVFFLYYLHLNKNIPNDVFQIICCT